MIVRLFRILDSLILKKKKNKKTKKKKKEKEKKKDLLSVYHHHYYLYYYLRGFPVWIPHFLVQKDPFTSMFKYKQN